jgi:hypothetical protein
VPTLWLLLLLMMLRCRCSSVQAGVFVSCIPSPKILTASVVLGIGTVFAKMVSVAGLA